jgi:sortase (surface protein transpeptidase)
LRAHRDTQFRYLGELIAGDAVAITTASGNRTPIVSWRRASSAPMLGDSDLMDNGPTGSRLALVTCYPFTGIAP